MFLFLVFCFVFLFRLYFNLISETSLEGAFSYSGAVSLNIVSLEKLLDSRCSVVFGSCFIMFGGWFDCTFM